MPSKKAFTLIELLVVIAIIALLMAILMPSLRRAREQAQAQVCMAHVKGIGLGILMYLQENEYTMPDFYTHTGASNGHLWYKPDGRTFLKPSENHSYWGISFKDYTKAIELFGCPTFKNFSQTIADDMLYGEGDIKNSAFSMNGWLTKTKSTTMKRQSEVVVAHDHMEPRIENGNDMLCPDSSGKNLTHYRQGGGRSNWYRGIFRHSSKSGDDFETGGRLNCLWIDGHVTSIRETLGEEIPKRYYDPLGKN
jgi:prepilin-type N-terminal cleavage/methylation domain-containing protein/prepilin-type processing-associated H-X9-DG protein